jgi:hypothetical protein
MNREHEFARLDVVERWMPIAETRGVSRSAGSFLRAYRAAGGNPNKLSRQIRARRERFIAKILDGMREDGASLYHADGGWTGTPSWRHLALLSWAYTPDPTGIVIGADGRTGLDPGFCDSRSVFAVLPDKDVDHVNGMEAIEALRSARAIYVGERALPERLRNQPIGNVVAHRLFVVWAVEASEYDGPLGRGQRADDQGLYYFAQRSANDRWARKRNKVPACRELFGERGNDRNDGLWLDVAKARSSTRDPVIHAFDVAALAQSESFRRGADGNVRVYAYPHNDAKHRILTFTPNVNQVDMLDKRNGVVLVRRSQIVFGGAPLSSRQREFVSQKIPLLMHEGYPQRQAVAIALSMARKIGSTR